MACCGNDPCGRDPTLAGIALWDIKQNSMLVLKTGGGDQGEKTDVMHGLSI
jgi:hypothetical protein